MSLLPVLYQKGNITIYLEKVLDKYRPNEVLEYKCNEKIILYIGKKSIDSINAIVRKYKINNIFK